MIFGNRRIDTKCVLIFCTNFIRNSFISGRIERDITVNVHVVMQNARYFYWILTKLEFSGHILMKVSCVKFHAKLSSRNWVVACGLTGRRDKANSRFPQICERARWTFRISD